MNNAIMEFSTQYPAFLKGIVSKHYPFSFDALQQWQHWVDWHLVAKNKNIAWTMEMIDAFPTAPIAEGMAQYAKILSDKTFLLAFCERYKDNAAVTKGLSFNKHIVWDQDLFEAIGDCLHLEDLSFCNHKQFPWSYAILDKYLADWNWEYLSFNPLLPWSLAFIDRYKDYIVFEDFFSHNPGVCAHYEIVTQYEDKLSWNTISMSQQLPWVENNLLEKWHDKINWTYIAANQKLLALPGFFETHISKWIGDKTAFDFLSSNTGLPWDSSLLAQYEEHWNWYEIAGNENIPWSVALIERFKSKLIEPIAYKEREDGLEKSNYRIANKLHYNFLLNSSIPWSIALLDTFHTHGRFDVLALGDHVWAKVFEPSVDASLIDLLVKNEQ